MRSYSPWLLLVTVGIYMLAWLIQSSILINWDVSWLMYASKKLVAGGTYSNDFFEVNPPLILYLYIPPVQLAKYAAISAAVALRIYVFLLATCSLCLCRTLANKIFLTTDHRIKNIFLILLATVFLILPMHEFGQREHLLMIFAFPYFLLMSRRLQNEPVSTPLAITIGLFSSLGFAMKPYFLITPFLIELYYMVQKRRISACIRPETLMLSSFLVAYAITIGVAHPDYLHHIIPLVIRIPFYQAYDTAWNMLLLNPYAIFSLLVALFCISQYEQDSAYQALTRVLLLALIGFLLSYLVQHTTWYYHASPANQTAIVLATFLLALFVRDNNTVDSRRMVLGLLTASMIFYVYWGRNLPTFLGFADTHFYGFFGMLLVALLYLAKTQPKVTTRCMLRYMVVTLMAVGILSFPFYNACQTFDYAVAKKARLAKLIVFMRLHAWHKPVFYFANSATDTLPAIEDAEAMPATRMEDQGWIPGFLAQQPLNNQLLQDKNFIIDMIADDLNKNKPEYILIDRSKNSTHAATIHFDYITYLSENAQFQTAWKNYAYFTTLENKPFYQFDIYKRS